ncbi:MAG TPA: ATP-binding protein [Luteolibacter sp.]|nr:ATP-binding protein [Luteolibacter sp.]
MSPGFEILLTTLAVAALCALAVVSLRLKKLRRLTRLEADAARQRYQREIDDAYAERDRLLDALGDAFLLVDVGGVIRFANAAAHDLFRGRELLRRPVREALLEPRLAESLLHCLETGEPTSSRVVLSQQTSPLGDLENRGVNAWIIDAARLPAHGDGGPFFTRVIIRDVTTEHQTDQIRKDFVANASHELRTPMAIINGYLENLLDDNMVDDPKMARRFLAVMRKHAERISRIVEDMLVISRLESGEAAALKIEPFRFRSCVKDVLERLESVIRSQQAEIRVTMDDDGFTLQGDRFYWTQVLFNLVENALKQNPHPGLQVEIGCRSDAGTTQIWVADNGIGIPSSALPHIFRRFYRVEKHHSQQEIKGTGLGLSIVKRAIEAHGGNITVTSVPGRETKFLITLPE